MTLVVDTSSILALALDGEERTYAERVLEEILANGGIAPSIFWYEVRNVLVVNERRGRITRPRTDSFLASLEALPIEIAPLSPDLGILELARNLDLAVYDAAYLDLAQRGGRRLATLDQKLQDGASRTGVDIF